mmetsp:Transcript_28730/g.70368  ORF Transcript_28730/g.70368 Transcript_28730/m.70368 type:complete len:232 (+) Transcript_28730:228-923(+)
MFRRHQRGPLGRDHARGASMVGGCLRGARVARLSVPPIVAHALPPRDARRVAARPRAPHRVRVCGAHVVARRRPPPRLPSVGGAHVARAPVWPPVPGPAQAVELGGARSPEEGARVGGARLLGVWVRPRRRLEGVLPHREARAPVVAYVACQAHALAGRSDARPPQRPRVCGAGEAVLGARVGLEAVGGAGEARPPQGPREAGGARALLEAREALLLASVGHGAQVAVHVV